MTHFTHEVAISAVSFDAMLVAELSERIARRAGPGILWRTQRDDMPPDAAHDAAAAAAIADTARIVVVLHQRLWARDEQTASDAAALASRVKAKRQKTVCMLCLDDTAVPSQFKTANRLVLSEIGIEAAVEKILSRLSVAGGTIKPAPASVPAPVVPARPAWSDGPPLYMSQPRAHTALKREFDALTTELAERVKGESDRLGEDQVEMHCAPQRLVVQLGPVGLSMSWVAGRSGNLADGRLLVIEWDGAITHGRQIGGAKTASPTRESLYRPEAKGPDDWCWRPETGDGSSYTSRNLAGQCFSSANMARPS
jgi:hypothetical protein